MAKFATLDSIKKEDDEEKREDNTYYAGGARGAGQGGSGINVIGGPGEGGRDSEDHVRDIFRRAETGPAAEGSATGESRRTITMYRLGFTVDDGPFRRLDDPANREFLKDLSIGQTPRELRVGAQGGDVLVSLVDKHEEDYVPPAYVAYGGEGQTMGSSTLAEGALVTGDEGVVDVPEVDESQPSTTLQIRMHDGRRVRAQLNMHHTIQHIHAIIRR
ncbi:unnamed protein product [Discosporangium mesarthrocarpum]